MDNAHENQDFEIRSARFRKEREKSWKALQDLVMRVEKDGVQSLHYEQALELNRLYALTLNSLSVARAISMDKALLNYLDQLCARAYLAIYAPQETVRSSLTKLFKSDIPRAVRASWLPMVLGFFTMIIGGLIGFALFFDDQSWFYSLVSPGLADGRTPEASVEYLREGLFDGADMDDEDGGVFASFLFQHNTMVAIFVFALGVFAAAPAYLLTLYNGLVLGAFYALYHDKGLGYEVFGWLSIHGVTEISAICIACAAGTKLGMAVVNPGDFTRREALRRHGRDATILIVLAMIMLVAAAILEGYFRQWVNDTETRLFIGWGLGAIWLSWWLFGGSIEEAST